MWLDLRTDLGLMFEELHSAAAHEHDWAVVFALRDHNGARRGLGPPKVEKLRVIHNTHTQVGLEAIVHRGRSMRRCPRCERVYGVRARLCTKCPKAVA